MEEIEILGYLAAILTTTANLPQAYKIIKSRSTKAISFITYLMLVIGNGLWLTYGIFNADYPLIVSNAISTAICIIILMLKFISKQQLEVLSDKLENNLKG